MLNDLVSASEMLLSLQTCTDAKHLPWVLELSKSGMLPQIQEMDTSAKSWLSSQADGFLRATRVVTELLASDVSTLEVDVSKSSQVKDLVLKFVQLSTVPVEQLAKAGFQDVPSLVAMIRGRVVSALKQLHQRLADAKSALDFWVTFQPCIGAVGIWDEEKLQPFLPGKQVSGVDVQVKKMVQGWLAVD